MYHQDNSDDDNDVFTETESNHNRDGCVVLSTCFVQLMNTRGYLLFLAALFSVFWRV